MSASTQSARPARLRVNGKHGLLAELLLWFVWVPGSLLLLFFMLENFLLSDFLF